MPTHADALSRIYARSLFEMAMASGGEPSVVQAVDELGQIAQAAQSDSLVRRFMSTGAVAKSRRGEVIEKAFRGRVSDLVLRFLMVLNSNDRLSHFESIVDALRQMLDELHGRVAVEVITAGELGDAQVQMLRDRIQAAVGYEPALMRSTDERMIGGLKVKIGDRLIDGSVAGRLRRLRHQLLTRGDAEIRKRTDTVTKP